MNGQFSATPERGAEVREPFEHPVAGWRHGAEARQARRPDPAGDAGLAALNAATFRHAVLMRVPASPPLVLRAQGAGVDGLACRFG